MRKKKGDRTPPRWNDTDDVLSPKQNLLEATRQTAADTGMDMAQIRHGSVINESRIIHRVNC